MNRNKIIIFVIFILLLTQVCFAGEIGSVFPSFTGKAIDDAVTSVASGVTLKAEVVVMTFSRQDMAITDSWVNTVAAKYAGNQNVAVREVAVIPDMPFITGIILNGIKGAIAQNKWKDFIIYSGDKEAMMKSLGAEDASLFYVYVVGKGGVIKWFKKGAKPAEEDIAGIMKAVEKEIKRGS